MAEHGGYLFGYIVTADQIIQDAQSQLYSAIHIWDVKRVAEFPAVIPVNFLAQVWGMPPDTPVHIEVWVAAREGGEVLQHVEARGSVPANPDAPVQGMTLALNQVPVRFNAPGDYEVRLFANGRLVGQRPLLVRPVPAR